jgi:hypothetical protein
MLASEMAGLLVDIILTVIHDGATILHVAQLTSLTVDS